MAGSVKVTVDNSSLFKGANNSAPSVLEVPDSVGVERIIPQGAFVCQKSADGTLFVEHSLNLALNLAGVTSDSLTIGADLGITENNFTRVYRGHLDETLLLTANAIASLDIIPAGATYSYRVQLEDLGFVVEKSEQICS